MSGDWCRRRRPPPLAESPRVLSIAEPVARGMTRTEMTIQLAPEVIMEGCEPMSAGSLQFLASRHSRSQKLQRFGKLGGLAPLQSRDVGSWPSPRHRDRR